MADHPGHLFRTWEGPARCTPVGGGNAPTPLVGTGCWQIKAHFGWVLQQHLAQHILQTHAVPESRDTTFLLDPTTQDARSNWALEQQFLGARAEPPKASGWGQHSGPLRRAGLSSEPPLGSWGGFRMAGPAGSILQDLC